MKLNEYRDAMSLNDEHAYRQWRDWKLAHRATSLEDLVVEVADPVQLTTAEHARLIEVCHQYNTAIYVCDHIREEKTALRRLGQQFSLQSLDYPKCSWRALRSRARSPRIRHTSYWILVHRPAILRWASSSQHLTMLTLSFR